MLRLRMHLRMLTAPDPTWLGNQLAGCQKIFPLLGIEIPAPHQSTADFRGGVVRVGGCDNAALTQDQVDLFGQRTLLASNEILVIIAGSLDPGWGGCAVFPSGQPGLVLPAGPPFDPEWILAHELGHVLGLFHINDDPSRLMYPSTLWTLGITPTLTQEQTDTVRQSDLLK